MSLGRGRDSLTCVLRKTNMPSERACAWDRHWRPLLIPARVPPGARGCAGLGSFSLGGLRGLLTVNRFWARRRVLSKSGAGQAPTEDPPAASQAPVLLY